MQTPQPGLLVDQIFARIAIRYGSAWASMWTGLDVAVVKSDWANELAGLTEQALRYGVVNLPLDRPPNAAQFKAICLRCPVDEAPRLGYKGAKADPARLAKAKEALDAVLARKSKQPRRAWAAELRAREKSGESLTEAQRNAWRTTMSAPDQSQGGIYVMKPIPPECLPPGGLRPEP